jgi:hypothetical protein
MDHSRCNFSAPSLWRSLPLVVCIALAALGATRPDDQQTRMNESCGPQALVTAFALGGQQVEASQCATLAGTSPQGITTLSGLQEAARALGGRVRGMYLTPAELALLGRVAILHAAVPGRPDHYLVFVSKRERSLQGTQSNPIPGPAILHRRANRTHVGWKLPRLHSLSGS